MTVPPAQKLDIEGIAAGRRRRLLARLGRRHREARPARACTTSMPKGEIKAEIALPAELLANEIRYGFEGIAIVGTGDDTTLWMAVQREWKDDEKGFVKLVSYNPKSKEWGAVRYPLERRRKAAGSVCRKSPPMATTSTSSSATTSLGDAARLKKLYKRADIRAEAGQARRRAAGRQEDRSPRLPRRPEVATNGYVSTSSKASPSTRRARPTRSPTMTASTTARARPCSSRSSWSARTELLTVPPHENGRVKPGHFFVSEYWISYQR